jgi:hypothetical protein
MLTQRGLGQCVSYAETNFCGAVSVECWIVFDSSHDPCLSTGIFRSLILCIMYLTCIMYHVSCIMIHVSRIMYLYFRWDGASKIMYVDVLQMIHDT